MRAFGTLKGTTESPYTERRVVACAVEADVRGVWALHESGLGTRITHIPTGRKVYDGANVELAREIWMRLSAQIPRFLESLPFAGEPDATSMTTLHQMIAHAVDGASR